MKTIKINSKAKIFLLVFLSSFLFQMQYSVAQIWYTARDGVWNDADTDLWNSQADGLGTWYNGTPSWQEKIIQNDLTRTDALSFGSGGAVTFLDGSSLTMTNVPLSIGGNVVLILNSSSFITLTGVNGDFTLNDKSVEIQSGSSIIIQDGDAKIAGAAPLIVEGSFYCGGKFTAVGGSSLDVGGDFEVVGDFTSAGNVQTAVSGSVIIGGSLSATGSAYFDQVDDGTMTVGGTIMVTGGAQIDPDFNLDRFIWNGSKNNSWTTKQNWSKSLTTGDTPSALDNVIIPSNATRFPIVTGTGQCLTLKIKDGANLQLTGGTITVNSECTIENGGYISVSSGTLTTTNSLIIEDDAYMEFLGGAVNAQDITIKSSARGMGSFIQKGGALNVTGTATYELYLTGPEIHYVSAPLSGVASTVFTATGYPTNPTNPNWNYYDESMADDWSALTNTNAYSGWMKTSEDMKVGKGYSVAFPSAKTYTITGGDFNTGPITYSSMSFTDNAAGTEVSDEKYDGWNLIGNPYPCNLDWSSVGYSNVDAAIYFFNNGIYNYFVGAGTDNHTDEPIGSIAISDTDASIIPPCQGFFVRANTASPSVSFYDTDKTTTIQSFYKRKSRNRDITSFIRLKIQDNDLSDETVIYLHDQATNEYDGKLDAYKFFFGEDMPFIYTLTTEKNAEMAVNCLPKTTENITVKVGVKCKKSGNFKILLSSFLPGIETYLTDKTLNQTVVLDKDGYSFDFEAGQDADRFEVSFSIPNVWKGLVSDFWNEIGNWENSVPTPEQNVYIQRDADISVNSDDTCNDLNLGVNSKFVISEGNKLIVNDKLILKSYKGENAIFWNKGILEATGGVEVEQSFTKGIHFVTIPVRASKISIYGNLGIKAFDETTLSWIPVLADADLISGKGYKIENNGDDTVITHTSGLNYGDVMVSLEKSNELNNSGLNMVANPYTTPIKINDFIGANGDLINATIYTPIETDYGVDYTYYNSIGSVSNKNQVIYSDGLIQSGKAFLIKAKKSGNLKFTSVMQDINGMAQIKRSGIQKVKLAMSSDTKYNELLLAYFDGATQEFDEDFDAIKLKNTDCAFYSTQNEDDYAIQAFPELSESTDIVNLAYELSESGTYEISAVALENIPEDYPIVLEDKEQHKWIDLKTTKYSFETKSGSFSDRFAIHFNDISKFDGNISDDWNEDNNWNFGQPLSTTNVILDSGKPIDLKIDAQCNNLIIEAGSNLTIDQGVTLTVEGNLVLKNHETDFGTLIEKGNLQVKGNVLVEKYLNFGTEYISSPVAEQQTDIFDENSLLKKYNEKLEKWDTLTTIQNIDVAKGYVHESFYSNNVFLTSNTLNKGDINTELNNNTNGLNLIGNPYPSYINWDLMNFDDQIINSALYRWDYNTGKYNAYVNGIGIGSASPIIKPTEAFFVIAQEPIVLSFADDVRVTRELQSSTQTPENFIKLKTTYLNQEDNLCIYVADESTYGFDNTLDALKIYNPYGMQFYALTDDNKQLAINAIPLSAGNREIILELNPNRTDTERVYSIEAETIKLTENTIVNLVDMQNNTITNLVEDDYQFRFDNSEKRQFKLLFSVITDIPSEYANFDDKKIEIWLSENTVFVKNNNTKYNSTQIYIYDVLGRSVFSKDIGYSPNYQIDINENPGVYMIKVVTDNKSYSQKLFIK